MTPPNWYDFAVKEIESSSVKMTDWEKEFMNNIKLKLKVGFNFSEKEEKALLSIHKKMTEIKRILKNG